MIALKDLAGAATIIAILSGMSSAVALPADAVSTNLHQVKGGNAPGALPSGVTANGGAEAIPHHEHEHLNLTDETHRYLPAGRFDPLDPRFNTTVAMGSESFGKRDVAGVYECAGNNWRGPCTWTIASGGRCHNRIHGSSGSMGPDRGIVCRVYEQPNCNDNGWISIDGFRFPGIPNYGGSDWLYQHGMSGNGIVSYKCRWG